MNTPTFTVQDDKKTLVVERVFDAPVSKVWEAWTTQQLLEQWWAPSPWKAITKSFDFSNGGHWHYAMTGPEGEQHWAWMGYDKIDPGKSFKGDDGFCDEEGNLNHDLPIAEWINEFMEQDGKTLVRVTSIYPSAEDLDKIMKMGFKEGFTLGLDQLEELLKE